MESSSSSSSSSGGDDEPVQRPSQTPVYRNNSAIEYRHCTFLGPYDVVLAADAKGRIDVVRLPPVSQRHHDFDEDEQENDHADGTGSSTSSAILASEVYSPPAFEQDICALQSLRRGEVFAVGTPAGALRLFATEHGSSWCAKFQNDATKGRVKPTALFQNNLPRRRRRTDNNDNPPPPALQDPCFVTTAWRVEGPKRRYERDYSHSLAHLIRSQGTERSFLHHLTPIWNWEQPDESPRQIQFCYDSLWKSNALWDFRETPSNLLILHVGYELDYFGLRIMDDRESTLRSNVVVDMKMDECKGFNFSGACFFGDWAVATCALTEKFSSWLDESHVKIWDLRMLKSGEYISKHVLSSFPRDSVIDQIEYEKYDAPLSLEGVRAVDGRLVVPVSQSTQDFDMFVVDVTKGKHETVRLGRAGPHFATHSSGLVAAVHDYDRAKSKISMHHIDELLAHNKAQPRKRSLDGRTNPAASPIKEFSIPYTLRDRYGVPTQLSCVAFNESGTSLVGGSVDGDLFAF